MIKAQVTEGKEKIEVELRGTAPEILNDLRSISYTVFKALLENGGNIAGVGERVTHHVAMGVAHEASELMLILAALDAMSEEDAPPDISNLNLEEHDCDQCEASGNCPMEGAIRAMKIVQPKKQPNA